MKLSEFKNEDALDLLADIMEPAAELLADESLRKAFAEDRIKAVKLAIKGHKKAVLEIMARLDGKDPMEYECNVFALPAKIIEVLNDRDLIDFFSSQVQNVGESVSGPVMENIVGVAKK